MEVDGENIKTSIDETINAPQLTMVVIFGIGGNSEKAKNPSMLPNKVHILFPVIL